MPAFTGHTTGQADFPHPALGQDFALARATLPALPGSRGTTNLSATPGRPACPSRASGWSSLTTPWGFLTRGDLVEIDDLRPGQQIGVSTTHQSFDFLHPAATASASVQNHRSPL